MEQQQKEQQQDNVMIYNVSVNTPQGQVQRKAIDVMGLKQFLEDRKAQFSIFNLKLDQIDQDDKVFPFIARASLAVIDELEDSINSALGIAQPEPEEDEGEEQEEAIPTPAPPPGPATPIAPTPVGPVIKEADVSESEDKIVL